MEENEAQKWPFSQLHHLGVIVEDVDKTAKYYESLGFGPFRLLKLDVKERKLRGELVEDPNLKVRIGYVGPIQFELFQPDKGTDSVWSDFLKNRGEGVQHLAFAVNNIDREEAELVTKGLNVTVRIRWPDGGATYFETEKLGGLILEICENM